MAKPPRSPLVGYNHNVKYGGHIFHIQTEDSGPGNPHILTHIFYEGSILGSKRCQYEAAEPDDKVRSLMQDQHKAILRDLKHQAYDQRIVAFFASRGEVFASEELVAQSAPVPAPEHDDKLVTHPPSHDNSLVTPPPGPAPLEVPITPGPAEAALDLDAIPAAPAERRPSSEQLPIHLAKPALPGPGIYNFQRPTRDERVNELTSAAVLGTKAPPPSPIPPPIAMAATPAPLAAPPSPAAMATPTQATPAPLLAATPDPAHVSQGTPAPLLAPAPDPAHVSPGTPAPLLASTPGPAHVSQATPGPLPTATPGPAHVSPGTPAPLPASTPAPTTPGHLPGQVATPSPVVLQKQVVVGAGAKPGPSRTSPTTPVRRRPLLGGPFVVKEGSYVSIPPTASASSPHPAAASTTAGEAKTAESQLPEHERSKAPVGASQSLDDVILAYLAQGEHKR
ncbi:MAG: hypothetical protein ABSB49_03690 [Polyangia bacterium]|jgi:hypothetical protein